MLLPKKISATTQQRASRKSLEKRIKEVKGDASFKLPKEVKTLLLDTAAVLSHLSVAGTWHAHQNSELDQTLQRVANSHDTKDPIDKAVSEYYALHYTNELKHGPMHTLPFDKTHAISGSVWHYGDSYELAVKGAPEHVLALCDLTENEREAVERKLHQLAGTGDKIIALAHASLSQAVTTFDELSYIRVLQFDGFVSLAQHMPPRIKTIVTAARRADIPVYLITGDHSESALHVAKEIGVATHRNQVFDSRRMHVMSSDEREHLLKEIRVFSRTTSQNKSHIRALFDKNEVLSLTIQK